MVQVSYACVLIVAPALFFAKSTIFLFYLRVFSVSKMIRYGVWFGLFWNFCLYWSSIPVETVTSAPRVGQPWNIETINRKNKIATTYSIFQGVFSVALDLYIFLLPIPVLMKLQMSLRRRCSILGVFGTAILLVLCIIETILQI